MRTFVIRLTMAFSLPFAIGCQSSDNVVESDVPRISILEDHIRPFDQVVSEVKFISLRPPENTAINLGCVISEIIITDKIYYCTKCQGRFAVHVFDLQGKYVNGLTKMGEGPEEYQLIRGFHLDGDTLSISSGKGQIKQYILPDFTFTNQFPLGKSFSLSSFHRIAASSWLIASAYSEELLDEAGKYPVYMLVNSEKNSSTPLRIEAFPSTGHVGEGNITPFDKRYLLNFGFSDTLYTYDRDHISPHYVFDFGERHPSIKVITADREEIEENIINQSITINLGHIAATEKTVQLKTFGLRKNPNMDLENLRTFPFHNVFISPEQQVVGFSSFTGLEDKAFAKDGFFYEVLQTENWMYALENDLFGSYGTQLEAYLETIPDPEDPIIMQYKVMF